MRRFLFLSIVVSLMAICFPGLSTLGEEGTEGQTALLLIDIQNFYFPGGSLPLSGPEDAVRNAGRVLEYFRKEGRPVIHVRHESRSGAEIHAGVNPLPGEKQVTKTEVNAFKGTDLLETLRSLDARALVICGMQTHMCLEAAVRAAHDFDFECTVIRDACATRDLKFGEHVVRAADVHASTLATLSGTYAEVVTTDEFLALNRKGGH